jgi:hypothetical protein
MQMTVLPAHRNLQHVMQLIEHEVDGAHRKSPAVLAEIPHL